MTNRICHRVIAISRIFLKDQWKFLPWWLLSKSEYNATFLVIFKRLFSKTRLKMLVKKFFHQSRVYVHLFPRRAFFAPFQQVSAFL